MVLNLFGTVAHFVFLKSLHGPLLCGPRQLGHCFVFLRLENKRLHFRVSVVCPAIALISKKKILHFWESEFFLDLRKNGQRIGVPDFCQFSYRYNWNKTFLNQVANFSNSYVAHRKTSYGPLVKKHWPRLCERRARSYESSSTAACLVGKFKQRTNIRTRTITKRRTC